MIMRHLLTIRRSVRTRIFESLEARYVFNVGDLYGVPPTSRVSQNLDASWKFALNPVGTPQSTSFDDSSWSTIDLPYTWDGMTVGPPSGTGWYRKTVTIDPSSVGKELYLDFGGAYQVTNLYIDGTQVDYNSNTSGTLDSHNGGFAEFNFDVTSQLTAGSHLITVSVNNNTNGNISPAGAGDYTKQGGIYRDVLLVAINQASHIAQIESAPGTSTPVATQGVYFSNSSVFMGIAAANIQVKTVLDNLSASTSSVNLTSYLVDGSGIIQSQTTIGQTLAAGQKSLAVTQNSTVANPHLWNGRIDPYLYSLYVEVRDSSTGALIDYSQQQVGIRSFKINAQPIPSDPNLANQDQAAFELNGLPYKLVGVNIHQDSGMPGQLGVPEGWAQTAADIQQQVDLVLQVGATLVRTAHYEHSQKLYEDADKSGLILEVDGDLQGTITATTLGSAFVNNYEDQLTEEVKQNYNHPSIIAWSMYNEIGNNTNNANLIANLSAFVHGVDSTGRYTTADSNDLSSTNGIDTATDLLGQHPYYGWYGGSPTQDGTAIDNMHSANPTRPLAITEYGAGGNPWQYTTNIQLSPPNPNGEHFHPENSQSKLEELAYAQFASRDYLWGIALWNMFDFSSSGRNEGDTQGQNDKGLITRDRQTKKDSFYFYQANWNDPARSWANLNVLYISDHNWNDRIAPSTSLTVYSNMGAPTLWNNGVQLGTMVPLIISGITIPDTYTMSSSIALATGANNIVASLLYGGQTYSNSVVWIYHAAALSGTSLARVDFTNSAANLQSGYVADTGQAFNGSLGWADPTTINPVANTAGTYNRTSPTTAPFDQIDARTGIMLPPNRVWEYALPNGLYDVHIVSADSTNPNAVNNLSIQGIQLHDLDSTDFGDNGFDEFYAQVYVSNGRLTLSAGSGAVSPRIAYIDINVIDNVPPSVVISNFQSLGPQQLQVQFSENVSASVSTFDLTLLNQTTGQVIDPAKISVSYNLGINTATFTFPGFTGGMLPVGNYQATISANSVTDAAGNPLAADFGDTILQTIGDWNLDGQRDAQDLNVMLSALCDLSSYQTIHSLSAPQLKLVGDINHSGSVDNSDIQAMLDLLISGSGAASGETVTSGTGHATTSISSASDSTAVTPKSPLVTHSSLHVALVPLQPEFGRELPTVACISSEPGIEIGSTETLTTDAAASRPSVGRRLSGRGTPTDAFKRLSSVLVDYAISSVSKQNRCRWCAPTKLNALHSGRVIDPIETLFATWEDLFAPW